MGILDNALANFRGNFNAAGRGARAGDTQYFSGSDFTPGLPDISQEVVPDAGFVSVPTEDISSSNYDTRSAQRNEFALPDRDLTQNPLTEFEAKAAQGVKGALGLMPFGGVISAGIDYNTGKDAGSNMNPRNLFTETPDTMAGRTAFWQARGNDLSTAAEAAVAQSQPGRLVGMSLPAGLQGSATPGYFGKNYIGQGFQGLGDVGYDPRGYQFTPGTEPAAPEVTQADITENYASAPDAAATPDAAEMPYFDLNWQANSGGRGATSDPDYAFTGGQDLGFGATDQAGFGTMGGGGYGTQYDGGGSDSFANGGIVGLSGPRYADGGAVGPLLQMGFADGGTVGSTPSPEMVNQQVSQILRNPQMRQRIVAGAQQLMQTGELTPQEVNTMGQIAEASMQNPALYPKLRQFVAQQGLSPLPPSYDPSVIVKILAISRALTQTGGNTAAPGGPGMTPPGQVPPTEQAQMQNPAGMANGGFLQGPGTGRSDSIGTVNESTGQPVRVANGEYVIPEHVVRAKGRDFFDKMLRQYADVPKQGA
jgi:hypothetical protein